MKKVFALLITVVLILSLAACGNSGSDSNGENGSVNPTAAVTPTVKETAAATEFDYDAKAQELREQIAGNWTFYNWMYKTTSNHLIFNADGTGSYQGGVVEDGKYEMDYTFTYTISVEPNEKFSDMIDSTVHVHYNEIDETEDRPISFIDGKLHLGYSDGGIWIIQYDEYTREEDIPQS